MIGKHTVEYLNHDGQRSRDAANKCVQDAQMHGMTSMRGVSNRLMDDRLWHFYPPNFKHFSMIEAHYHSPSNAEDGTRNLQSTSFVTQL